MCVVGVVSGVFSVLIIIKFFKRLFLPVYSCGTRVRGIVSGIVFFPSPNINFLGLFSCFRIVFMCSMTSYVIGTLVNILLINMQPVSRKSHLWPLSYCYLVLGVCPPFYMVKWCW